MQLNNYIDLRAEYIDLRRKYIHLRGISTHLTYRLILKGRKSVQHRSPSNISRSPRSFNRSPRNLHAKPLPLPIAVKYTDVKDADGNWEKQDEVYPCQQLLKSTGYNLSDDDPGIYTDEEDVDGYSPRREWPDEPLPKRPSPASMPSTSSNQELIDSMLQVHHSQVEVLKSLGVDACQHYQDSRVESILNRLSSGQVNCVLCGDKNFNSTQKLRNHIKIIHLKKTKHQCNSCDKYFGDSRTLKIHKRSHAAGGYTFQCDQCNKSYASIGKLNEHKQSHNPAQFQCRYCKKNFAHKRNRDEHQAACTTDRDLVADPIQMHKCQQCDKQYKHKKDLTRHRKTHQ